MEKTYNPHAIEATWYERWEKANDFAPTGKGTSYCIVLPPPNVTGSLHMGHGFQHTLMDTLIRYHRMKGRNTLWQGGVDHAGIATQIVVERQLEKENVTRESLGREKFLEKVWQWKHESGDNISRQMRRLGSSIDWPHACFTMDENFTKAVKTAFTKLYNDGLIYRGKRLVNWDVKLQSAVSDLEVVSTEEQGNLWHIRYYLNEKEYLVVATTRPETLFGDTAVAVHPEDVRYKHLIGKKLKLPLTSREIPIIADDYVDPTFGTGCVKITPAHDFNDYAMGQRHQLPLVNILNKNGTLNDKTPYENIDRFTARKKLLEALEAQNLIEKIEAYKTKIPRSERTGEIVEPFLTDQWYIKMAPLAKRAIKAFENGEVTFIPENWSKTYLQWLENIQDWCISRQLWWGHRIPAYYDAEGNIFVGDDKNQAGLQQDNDVLDTWFSAALWPFAALGWPEKTPRLEDFYPTTVLVTGFDIIFFWVARMVMFGLYFTDKVPFKEIYITGLIRDRDGHKMSKSKGNVLDPIDLIDGISLEKLIEKRTYGLMNPKMEKKIAEATRKEFPEGIAAFGTDALRFTYCALANTGRDIRFDLGRVSGYRNFCNKLWNASRFVLTNETFTQTSTSPTIFDAWILSNLQKLIQTIEAQFAQYRFDLIAQNLYEFFWYDYCDWYLELSKIHPSENTKKTLLHVLEIFLKLLHPVMPYITEEIYLRIHPTAKTIQQEKYPVVETSLINTAAEEKMVWFKNIVTTVRNIRSEMQIPPSKKIVLYCYKGSPRDKALVQEFSTATLFLTRAEKMIDTDAPLPRSAIAVAGELQLFIPLAEYIDIDAEIHRLKKEMDKVSIDIEKSTQKLSSENYVNKAPEAVVTQERERLNSAKAALEKLSAQIQRLHG
jgi:valyl-tRNA synthetase